MRRWAAPRCTAASRREPSLPALTRPVLRRAVPACMSGRFARSHAADRRYVGFIAGRGQRLVNADLRIEFHGRIRARFALAEEFVVRAVYDPVS